VSFLFLLTHLLFEDFLLQIREEVPTRKRVFFRFDAKFFRVGLFLFLSFSWLSK